MVMLCTAFVYLGQWGRRNAHVSEWCVRCACSSAEVKGGTGAAHMGIVEVALKATMVQGLWAR